MTLSLPLQSSSDQLNRRPITTIVSGVAAVDGAGVRITRTLGSQALRVLDPFLLLDMMYSDQPQDYLAGFPDHPHRGFETVTYLLAGKVRHQDNKGHEGVIEPGGVQWMTAGRGIIHSEMPEQDNGLLWGFQLWLNLPAKDKMCRPHYQEFDPEQIPVEQPSPGIQVRVLAGQTRLGTQGPIQRGATEVIYWDVNIAPGHTFTEVLPPNHNAFIYLYEGNATVHAEQEQSIAAGTLAVLGQGEQIEISAGDQGGNFLLMSGKPLNEPIAHGGPFVMNSRAEVLQAYQDYQTGRF